MEFADPVIDIAVEPKTKAEQDKMGIALQKLAGGHDVPRVHQPGDRPDHHRRHGRAAPRIIIDRLLREFKVEANVGKPQVAYRERPARRSQRRGQVRAPDRRSRPVRPCGHQPDPAGGRRRLRVREQDRGRRGAEGVHPLHRQGHPGGAELRRARGLPGRGHRVELVDGSYHDVDSSEAAFKVAGSMAVKAALRKSSPVILEPMMAVEIETPEEYMGFVMGDIQPSRHDPGHGRSRQRHRGQREGAAGQHVRLRHRPAQRRRRAGLCTPCSSTPTSRCPRTWRRKLSARPAATRKRAT